MHIVRTITLSVLLVALAISARGDDLESGFKSPPDSARPHTWWHWMNGNVTKEGITKDLEAMKRIGLGGFQAFSVTDKIPPGPVKYMSPEWLDMMGHAVHEADRLGLQMCMHNCAGWSSSGGPWITPELSMQELVFSETQATGGKDLEIQLSQPEAKLNFYRDIAVVAFPTLKGDADGKTGFRLSDWTWKIDRNSPRADRKPDSQIMPDSRTAPDGDVIHRKDIVILTDKMDERGNLKWSAPAGDWTIVRFGHTTTGRTDHPAPEGGEGLECDKLSKAAAKFSWDHTVARVMEQAGPLVGKAFNNVLIDSYEVGFTNWTGGFDKIFEKHSGYDLIPYLPAITGRVIDNVDTTERFLWDFRRTIADTMAENYFGAFKELAHQNHMVLSIEPYGPGGFDDFQIAAVADIPMGEFWVDRPDAWHFWSVKLASSAAHALGEQFAGAESFTAGPPGSSFRNHPYTLKTLGDTYFARGLNRIIFHSNVHQPWGDDVLPGMTMGPHGIQMNRNNTWHKEARPWMDSLARTQFVLQQGQYVSDLCYLAAEDAPQTPLNRQDMSPIPPAGYDYDVLHASLVMQMSVKDGRLTMPSGMSYRVLVLPNNPRMRPELLAKIKELADAGASIYGPRPVASPSLQDQPKSDERVKQLGEELWGSGKIQSNMPLDDYLTSLKLPPDFEYRWHDHEPVQINAAHRHVGDREVYFVANAQRRPVEFEATFRAQGAIELWHPEDGSIEPYYVNDPTNEHRTKLPMYLDPAQSVFVVFHGKSGKDTFTSFTQAGHMPADGSKLVRDDGKLMVDGFANGAYIASAVKATKTVKIEQLAGPTDLTGPWTVHFPKGWGAPESIEFPKLIDWTNSGNFDIQHFSGTATYRLKFPVKAEQLSAGTLAQLDLGDVQVMATVKLNGKDLGLLWKPPFRVDVTQALKEGDNDLEVRVTNLWINRLIGDDNYPPQVDYLKTNGIEAIPQWLLEGKPRPESKRKTFITWRHYTATDPLSPSGLLGPVKLIWGKEVEMK